MYVLFYFIYYNVNILQPTYFNPEDEASMLVFANTTTWYRNPEDHNQNE